MRPFKSIPGPGISGVPLPGIELKRLFCCPCDNRTPGVLSAPICGSEGGKRISLTQGERLHEGSAPSDKRPDRLTIGLWQGQIPWVDK